MPVLKKPDIFWNKTRCNKKWNLLVYNSVIVSRVLYGLEALEPPQNIGRMLDVFQVEGLRRVLNLHTIFINRNKKEMNLFTKKQMMR